MEKLILVLVFALCIIQPSKEEIKVSSGVITMEDMILRVILDDPSDKIESVKVYDSAGEFVTESSGCYKESCTYALAAMESGIYEVYVSVQNGSGFSGSFMIQ